MNLKDFFSETEGKVGDQIFSANNMDFSVEEEDMTEKIENAKIAKQNMESELVNKKAVKLLNAGFSVKKIVKALNISETPESLIEYNDKYKSLTGKIFVDCSIYKDKSDYHKNAGKFKSYHRYAFNCNCEGCTEVNSKIASGDIDSFLNASSEDVVSNGICEKTGLKAIKSFSDVSTKDVAEIVYKISSIAGKTQVEAKNILISNDSITAIKKAFNMMNEQPKIEANVKSDAKFYNIKESIVSFDVMEDSEDIDVSPYGQGDEVIETSQNEDNIDVEFSNEQNKIYTEDDSISSVENVDLDIVNESDSMLEKIAIEESDIIINYDENEK